MREKYESLPLTELKAIAKARGMKNISALKKAELVDAMVALDDKEAAQKKAETPAPVPKAKAEAPASTPKAETPAPAEKTTQPRQEQRTAERPVQARPKKVVYRVNSERQNASERQNPQERQNASERQNPQERQYAPVRKESPAERPQAQAVPTAQPAEQNNEYAMPSIQEELLGPQAKGILEVMPDGFGFIRSDNYLPGEADVYVAPSQIRKFNLKTGDIITGITRPKSATEKFSAIMVIQNINGFPPADAAKRGNFEDMIPIFPDERLHLETRGASTAMRIVDLVSPIGKGQRGMIVSPPKAGKTTLLKQVAKAVQQNHPSVHMIILLIDERPEEVTDIKESVEGPNVEVIYSTFDELPEHHKRVSEMVIERAKRLVEHGQDVMILLDSITRLARAYNLTVPPSGRTLSGGLDPAALHMPKKFFGAARNMRNGGSLTILATALVDTGSKMDDVVYEEFKGTGNMELVLDRKLSEKRVFPAIDIVKSGTRREDLLLNNSEQEAVNIMRKEINGMKPEDAVETILNLFSRTHTNRDFCEILKKTRISK